MTMITATKSVGVVSRNGRVRRNAGLKAITRSGGPSKVAREPTVSVGHGMYFQPDARPTNDRDNVSFMALRHGRYETLDTLYHKNPLEAELTPLVVNRAVTVIDDWIDRDVFLRSQVRVIEKARELWRTIKRPRHPFFDPPDPEDVDDSFESERAKALLHRSRRLVGNARWNIFENVIRWNEPTGVPGSRMATPRQSSIFAARQIVRDVADEIDRAWIF